MTYMMINSIRVLILFPTLEIIPHNQRISIMNDLFYSLNMYDVFNELPEGGVTFSFTADERAMVVERLGFFMSPYGGRINDLHNRVLTAETDGQSMCVEDSFIIAFSYDESVDLLLALDGKLADTYDNQPPFDRTVNDFGQRLLQSIGFEIEVEHQEFS